MPEAMPEANIAPVFPAYGRTIFPLGTMVSPAYMVAKRALDILGASVALLILGIPMLIVALLIKLESRGPALFFQYRLGENGIPFRFYKFRSMIVNAEQARADLQPSNEADGPVFKIRRDPRITRVGRWLRKTSLDETPQLLHVLAGQMSLVGPRPPLPEEVENYEPWQRERLAVRPGLTCIWQISGRSDIPFDRWVELDILYVRSRSLLLDLKILLLTPWAVISGRGAY
jgi:lipopolysaccharide/colanic/teichoic acid biosynthesis glycosyltransferase